MGNGRKGITGSTLKWIAIITMLIDHIGAIVMTRQVLYSWSAAGMYGEKETQILYYVMKLTRQIGRIAFPIFCFLLVEGFQRTKDIKAYLLRMAGFAVLSEIPFNLAVSGKIFCPENQSVMLTMWIGLLLMQCCYRLEQYIEKRSVFYVTSTALVGAGMAAADFLCTDYGAKGIAAIMVMYFLRRNRFRQVLGGCVCFAWEPAALFAFPFIWIYNGKRGMKMKWFFYFFYPVHLFLLYLICVMLGLGSISVI